MTIELGGEFLVELGPLPLQTRAPILEEAPRPARALVVPELAKGFLEQVHRVQPLVGGEQGLQALPDLAGEVLPMCEQRVLLAFDVALILPAQTPVLGLAHHIECYFQATHALRLVEQDRRLKRLRLDSASAWKVATMLFSR